MNTRLSACFATFTKKLILNKPARVWKEKYYAAIPYYLKPHFIDIHDSYKTRTLEEVKAELKDKQFQIDIQRVIYKTSDCQASQKGRKAHLFTKMKQFNLTELQMLRFKVLVGVRYKEETDELKLGCEMFDNYEQNFTKINEMLFEIIMETKRAP